MGQGNFTEDFRLDAIKQITERGHSVADVSQRLGVSTCKFACNIGSAANLLMFGSCCADHPGLKEVELSAAIHLPLDELESGNLALGVSIRPWGIDGGANSGFVFADTAGE